MQKSVELEYGFVALIEFIVSCRNLIGSTYKSVLDIGSGHGMHTKVFRAIGMEVFQLDKYSETAEYKVDFIEHDFDKKFDIVFCSHVIEHQRNVGNFLDKIFDVMNDDGLLLISAPKHPGETLIEGHLNCFFTTYFVQHLIHAGFDLKKGKYLSCGGAENAAIVFKAQNFDFNERKEVGYRWTEKHRERCFFELTNKHTNNETFYYNSLVFSSEDGKETNVSIPDNYVRFGIEINIKRHGLKLTI